MSLNQRHDVCASISLFRISKQIVLVYVCRIRFYTRVQVKKYRVLVPCTYATGMNEDKCYDTRSIHQVFIYILREKLTGQIKTHESSSAIHFIKATHTHTHIMFKLLKAAPKDHSREITKMRARARINDAV